MFHWDCSPSVFNAEAILDSIYQKSLTYNDMRNLFIGIFSRTPNNLFDFDRNAILSQELTEIYEKDADGEQLFEDLFTLQLAAAQCIEQLQKIARTIESASQTYQRFFKENSGVYRAYLTILATCAVTGIDISQPEDRVRNREQLIASTLKIIEGEPAKFERYYKEAFKTIIMSLPKNMEDDAIKQRLWDFMKKLNFSRVFGDTQVSVAMS